MNCTGLQSVIVAGLTPAEVDYLAKRVTHSARDGHQFITYLSETTKVARALTRFRRRRHRCR